MITLHQHFPDIPFGELVQWATGNGARALRMDKQLGTIEPGKRPGLNLITGLDLQELKLLSGSRVKRLI
jgi:cytosine/adenosine deaminase-related metal-dependent hydrolase